MSHPRDGLLLDDPGLIGECEVHIYKASGPGGQHRNKVSSAVRLHHKPSGVTATANDSRSQAENRKRALRRLRMNLALRLRKDFPPPGEPLPAPLGDCLHAPKKPAGHAPRRLQVGRRDERYWPVAAVLLDALDHCTGRLAETAGCIGISTGNLTAVLKQDRHLLAAAQQLRRDHDQPPIR